MLDALLHGQRFTFNGCGVMGRGFLFFLFGWELQVLWEGFKVKIQVAAALPISDNLFPSSLIFHLSEGVAALLVLRVGKVEWFACSFQVE